jgi:Right handed beta helix region
MKKLCAGVFLFLMVTSLCAFSGHITANATWSEDILITGDTWIDEGVTLTINAGVTVSLPKVDANADDIGDIDFIINGRLLTQGTPDNKVIFTSLEDDPQPDDWGGIDYLHVLSQNSNLQYTDVLFAHQGIHINGKLFTLNNGIIQECGDYGIRVENSFGESTSLNNVTVFENNTYGLKVETSGIVNGTAVLVSSNGSHGFWLSGTSNATFTNCRSVSNDGNGIYIVSASPSFSNTFINSNTASGVEIEGASSNPVFDNCSVEYNDENGFLFQDGCTGTVEYTNIIGNSEFGILVSDNSLPTINYCNIFDNCSVNVVITEEIPSNQLYLNNTPGYSPYYTILFPVNKVNQINVSGYANHDNSSDDYTFIVYDSNSNSLYNYSNINSSYDTNFNLWADVTTASTSHQLRAYLSVYSVYSYWGKSISNKV